LKTKQIDVAKHYGLHKSRVCEIARDKPQVYKEMEAKTKAGFDLEYGKQLGELAGLTYLFNLKNPATTGYAILSVGAGGFILDGVSESGVFHFETEKNEITEAINFMRGECYGS
jgi:hypothetical protein